MKHAVHPCDEIRGVGPHHTRVALESLENLGDGSNRHPVETIEPTPERVADLARACVVQLLREMRPLTVRERETVFLRIWDMPWHGIAAVLQLESVQSAEWQLRAALRKCPALRSLFPKTNNREKTNGR